MNNKNRQQINPSAQDGFFTFHFFFLFGKWEKDYGSHLKSHMCIDKQRSGKEDHSTNEMNGEIWDMTQNVHFT